MTDSSATLPTTVSQFIDALNRADNAALLAFFTPTALVVDVGQSFIGTDAIRDWNANQFIGSGGHAVPKTAKISGDTVTLPVDWQSKFYTGPSKMVFVLEGDKIAELRCGP